MIVSTAASRSSTISAPSASVLLGVLPRVRLRCSLVRAADLVSYLLTSLRFYYETVNSTAKRAMMRRASSGGPWLTKAAGTSAHRLPGGAGPPHPPEDVRHRDQPAQGRHDAPVPRTTHPFLTLQLLTGGSCLPEEGRFRTASGKSKYHAASDNLDGFAESREGDPSPDVPSRRGRQRGTESSVAVEAVSKGWRWASTPNGMSVPSLPR